MKNKRRIQRKSVSGKGKLSQGKKRPAHGEVIQPQTAIWEGGEGQLIQLPDVSTARPLRQSAVLQLQQSQGNYYVRRILTAPGAPVVQRALTADEKAENLKSPRFAGDERLEQVFDNSPAMRRGEVSGAVAKIQQALIDDGFEMPISTQKTGSPDGIFGRETKSTVILFQEKYSLETDGVVGRNTMRKMDELYAGPPRPEPKETPDIEATDEAMGQHVVDSMDKANDPTSFSPTSGIWYDHNYEAKHEEDPVHYPWNEDYRNGLANSTYFERIDWMDWRLRPGVSASEGIKAWLQGLTIAECLSTIIAIEIDTLRAAIGDKKFDDHFGSTDKVVPEAQRLRIRTGTEGTPIEKFMTQTEAAKTGDAGTFGNRPVQKGEWYYFYNHPKYLLKHPDGAFQGENAVYMGANPAGEQLWSGLGISNVTEEGMLLEMVEAYNTERDKRDYEHLVKHRATPPITEISTDYEALYHKYLNRIDARYRHDRGEFEDQITKEKILNDPEYTIDGTTRKGGFLLEAGAKLDAAKVKEMRDES
jgi:peptidoglycan hydrolase-like protein with peptidoglycan-binding domain